MHMKFDVLFFIKLFETDHPHNIVRQGIENTVNIRKMEIFVEPRQNKPAHITFISTNNMYGVIIA